MSGRDTQAGSADAREETLRAAIDSLTTHAFVTLDPAGIITSWNTGAQRLFGHVSERAVGRHLSLIFPADARESSGIDEQLHRAEQSGATTARHWLEHSDGTGRHVKATWAAFRGPTGGAGFAALLEEVPPAGERDSPLSEDVLAAQLETTARQLANANALLATEVADRTQAEAARIRLLRRLVVAQEEERRRIARDLHDDLGQQLTALRLTLEALQASAESPGSIAQATATALASVATIDQGLDFLAWELRPAALDELGLVKVLENYVAEWSRHAGVRARFHARIHDQGRFAPEVEATMYRITQEGLNNIAKHADARSVNVLLEQRGDNLALIIEDDGVGCRTAGASDLTFGLTGMRERAAAVGGTLDIEPTPGGGTTVLATIPMVTPSRVERRQPAPVGASSPPFDPAMAAGDSSDAVLFAIRVRLQELQHAVAARDEFIATVAHELRNPVSPLMFQVRLAIEKTEMLTSAGEALSPDWVQAQLRRIEQRLHRLLETLERLLDVSRLSTGRIDLQPEPVDLGRAVRDVIATFDAELAVARCKLVFSERGDPTGSWDRVRLEQICRNLLSNAIRFGAGRPIEVTVDGDPDFAMLQVRDHGVGIAADHHARIFERFERAAEQRSGGFGIGLWVVKNVCVAMGGSISVDSTPGEGACFTVMLPRVHARQLTNDQREDI